MDYAPDVIVPLVVSLMVLFGASIKAKVSAGSVLERALISGEAQFRKDLLEDIAGLRIKLDECEERCGQCMADHLAAKEEISLLKHRITILEDLEHVASLRPMRHPGD